MANAYYSDISDFLDYATKKINQLITEKNQQGLQKFVNELIQLADDVTDLAEGVPIRWQQYQNMLRQKDMMVQTINEQKAQIDELNKMMESDFGNALEQSALSDITEIDADTLASKFVDIDDEESPFDFGDSGIEIPTTEGDDYSTYSSDFDELTNTNSSKEENNDELDQDYNDLPSSDDFGDYDDGINMPDSNKNEDENFSYNINSDNDNNTIQQPIHTDGLSELGFDDVKNIINDSDNISEIESINIQDSDSHNTSTKGRLTRQNINTVNNEDENNNDDSDDGIDFNIDEEFLDF